MLHNPLLEGKGYIPLVEVVHHVRKRRSSTPTPPALLHPLEQSSGHPVSMKLTTF